MNSLIEISRGPCNKEYDPLHYHLNVTDITFIDCTPRVDFKGLIVIFDISNHVKSSISDVTFLNF